MGQEVVPRANTRVVVARKKRRAFLAALAETGGRVMEAAKAAGFTDTSALQRYRRDNEEFAEEWDHAVEAGTDMIEDEAIRRAVDGVHEPIYYKGEIAGYQLKYSDPLIMFILRGRRPDRFRENARGGDINMSFGIAVLPMTAPNEADWQSRAVTMHDKQRPIIIEAKPVENQMGRVERGD